MSPDAPARRGAIVGFGNVAELAHLPAWEGNPGFSIAAVVDPDRERRERARVVLPGVEVHERLDALLTGGAIDFVDVCTPPRDHADVVSSALAAGCDVLCEKPLVATLEDMRRIERGTHESGRVVYSVDNWKHAPIWALASRLIDEDAIGEVRDVTITVLRPPGSGGGRSDWRRRPDIAGGGILLDHGWHNLYLTLSLVRRPPSAVSARMALVSGTPLEEVVDLRLRFDDRAQAQMHLTWRAARRENRATVRGTGGSIELNDDHLLVNRDDRAQRRHDLGEALSASSHHADWMAPVVASFAREIEGAGRGRSLVEAGWCARLVHHAYGSARAGGAWVAVEGPPRAPARPRTSLEASAC